MNDDTERSKRERLWKLNQELRSEERKLVSFLTRGNAAGTIATLSLIGTVIAGSAPEASFPRVLFWMLLTFVVGLAGSWIELVFELLPYGQKYRKADCEGQVIFFRKIQLFMATICSICLFGGCIASLSFLFHLSR